MNILNVGMPFTRRYISADIQVGKPIERGTTFSRSQTSGQHIEELTEMNKYEYKEHGDTFCKMSHFSRHQSIHSGKA